MRTLAILLAGAVLALSIPASAYAFLPFGGVIKTVEKCPCGGGSMITVIGVPISPSGIYVSLPTTLNFPAFKNRVGAFILGTYLPGGTCCGVKAIGTILTKGTSI